MSDEDFLKNPASLFDVRGKTAIVTGATGAFGAVAAKTLAGAGASVVLAASNAEGLKKIAVDCQAAELRGQLRRDHRGRGGDIRRRRHPGRGIGPEQGVEDRRSKAGRL